MMLRNPPGEGDKSKGHWGAGSYLGGTLAPINGFTIEIGLITYSDGNAFNYFSIGLASGYEISASGGVIIVPQNDFDGQDWLGYGTGGLFNIPFTPIGLEYTRTLSNTNYHDGKIGLGFGYGASINFSYTIILPVVPPEIWCRPGRR